MSMVNRYFWPILAGYFDSINHLTMLPGSVSCLPEIVSWMPEKFHRCQIEFPVCKGALPGSRVLFPGCQKPFPGCPVAFPGYQGALPQCQKIFPGFPWAFSRCKEMFICARKYLLCAGSHFLDTPDVCDAKKNFCCQWAYPACQAVFLRFLGSFPWCQGVFSWYQGVNSWLTIHFLGERQLTGYQEERHWS